MNIELNEAEVMNLVKGLDALKREIFREFTAGQVDREWAELEIGKVVELRERVGKLRAR